jgi:hypothetical protein
MVSFLLAIGALVIGLTRKNKPASLRFFPFYFTAYVIISFSVFIVAGLPDRYGNLINLISPLLDLVLTLIEFWVFARFFAGILTRPRDRNILRLIRVVFFFLTFLIVSRDIVLHLRLRQETLQVIFTIQAISLLVPCMAYFVSIFTYTPVSTLKDEPHFWVVTGLSFMLICTFPLSLFLNYIEAHESGLYRYLFAIFYIFYSLLFLMIIRAYLCNPTSDK